MDFEYLEPKSIEEAVSLLVKYRYKAKVLAGGTDLIVQMRKRVVKPQYVVNIGFISGLDSISYDDENSLHIGALATIRAIADSVEIEKNHLIIAQAASQLASVAIRNVATVGGNLCNASPSADMVPALVSLSATAKIVGPDGERTVLLEEFFTGLGSTKLENGELLTEVQVPLSPPHTGGVYIKHAIRKSIDLTIVGVAAVITLAEAEICRNAKIVLGAVAPTAIRARQAEEVIKNKDINEKLVQECAEIAAGEIQPISDVRASAEYRKEMVKVFTRQAVKEAFNTAIKN